MKTFNLLVRVLLGAVLLVSVAHADNLFTTSGALTSSDPTQLGRISRDGIWSDWSAPKAFPGVINTTTTYYYTSYDISVGVTPYVAITFDSISANTFVAAYEDSYDPTNLATNYLGDPGRSGNLFFGTDPLTFNVFVPLHHQLVVVINNTAAGGVGLGDPYNLYVQGFLDTGYTSTPEPSSLFLLGSGALGLAGVIRRKLRLG
jgi:hypothetical protein